MHAVPLQDGAQNAVAAAASLGGGRSPGSQASSGRNRSRELLAEEDVEYRHAMVLQDDDAHGVQGGEPTMNHQYIAVRFGPAFPHHTAPLLCSTFMSSTFAVRLSAWIHAHDTCMVGQLGTGASALAVYIL